jgi:hypothetical protein
MILLFDLMANRPISEQRVLSPALHQRLEGSPVSGTLPTEP